MAITSNNKTKIAFGSSKRLDTAIANDILDGMDIVITTDTHEMYYIDKSKIAHKIISKTNCYPSIEEAISKLTRDITTYAGQTIMIGTETNYVPYVVRRASVGWNISPVLNFNNFTASDLRIADENSIYDSSSVEDALQEVMQKVNSITGANGQNNVEVVYEASPVEELVGRYTIYQGGREQANIVGTIDIPKDKYVYSGMLEAVNSEHPVSGLSDGLYLKLNISNSSTPVRISLSGLLNNNTIESTSEIALAISQAGNLKATIESINGSKLVNGSVTYDKLETDVKTKLNKADTAVQSASYAEDKTQLDGTIADINNNIGTLQRTTSQHTDDIQAINTTLSGMSVPTVSNNAAVQSMNGTYSDTSVPTVSAVSNLAKVMSRPQYTANGDGVHVANIGEHMVREKILTGTYTYQENSATRIEGFATNNSIVNIISVNGSIKTTENNAVRIIPLDSSNSTIEIQGEDLVFQMKSNVSGTYVIDIKYETN